MSPAAASDVIDNDSLALSYLEEKLPRIPALGQPERFYSTRARQAREEGDVHLLHAFKVAQYVTAALGEELSWEEKVRHFDHALNRHCEAPPMADDKVWMFYGRLAQLVRQQAAQEAFAIAQRMDAIYNERLQHGVPWREIERSASHFFGKMVSSQRCPRWFTDEDYRQLVILRNFWVRAPLATRDDWACSHRLAA
jgi:hypothetical protein